MPYLIKLAFRNIWRNRRRSLLAMLSVGLSLLVIVLLQSWIAGIMGSVVKNYTKNETGHVRIASKIFEQRYRFSPVTDYVTDPEEIIKNIESDSAIAPLIDIVTERIHFGVLLSHGSSSKPALALAGDPSKEMDLLYLHRAIRPGGRYLTQKKDIIIGAGLAEELNYGVGDTIRIMTQGSDYALHLKKCVISGIFKTGISMVDNNMFQMSITDARELLAMAGGTQQIVIMLKDWRKSDNAAELIRRRIADESIAVTPWTKIGEYYNLVTIGQAIYNFLYTIVALLGAFIINNIMTMVVMERRKEIGIMKSMGVKRSEIAMLFLTEGALLGIAGSIGGIILGVSIVTVLHNTGVDLTSMLKTITMPIDNVIHPTLTPAHVAKLFGIGTILSALVSLAPSMHAAGMNAVESIKSV